MSIGLSILVEENKLGSEYLRKVKGNYKFILPLSLFWMFGVIL